MAPHWKLSLCLALAYIATGYIGLMLPMFGTSITLIWLPTGISVGMLFRYGYGCWPGVAVGALVTNLSIGSPFGVSLGIACGNTLGPILATYLLHRLRFERSLERQHDILLLVAIAAVSMSISASLGIGTLSLAGVIQSDYRQAWFTWWAGDAMGIIAAAPIVLVLNRKELRFLNQRRIEFAWWMLINLFLVFVIFILNGRDANNEFAVAFLALPSMVWAAMRFGATGTSLGVILLSFSAAIGIANGSGPFKGKTPTESAILFSLFMMTCALVGWLVRYLNDAQRQTLVLQQLMERAMNDASLGLVLSDSERRITYANDGFSSLTGYSAEEVIGKSCRLLQGPETDPATLAKLKMAFKTDGKFSGPILNYRKDGSSFWNALSISPIYDESGKLEGYLGIQEDTTLQKQIQNSLARSEERLRVMLDLEPECVKILSMEGNIIEMNAAGLQMLEVDSIEEVRGRSALSFVAIENRDEFLALHQKVVGEGHSGKYEFAAIGCKGTRRWMESNSVPFRNDRHKIVGHLSVVRDITDQKVAVEALQESESRFRALTNHAPVGIFTTDLDGQCTLVNARWSAISGLSFELAKGTGWSNALHRDDRARVYQDWNASVHSGSEFVSDYRFEKPDGSVAWVHGTAMAMRDDHGNVTGYVGTITDLTELFHAKEVLLRAEEQQRLALDAAAMGTWKFEFDSEWVQLDEQSRKIFDRKDSVIRRTEAIDQIHPDDRDRVESEFSAAYDPNGTRKVASEYRIQWDNGEVRWVSVRAKSYFANESSSRAPDQFIGAVRDVTDTRIYDERIQASLREKEAMLKEIHHRVKNNLQIVTSLLSLQSAGKLSPDSIDVLEESKNRIRSMALVHESLYSTEDLGHINIVSYLDQLCSYLFRSFGIDPSVIQLELKIDDVVLNLERAIPFGLIVNELLSNCLKYAFPDGRTGVVLVQFCAAQDDCFALTVSDNGVGLPDTFDLSQLNSLGLKLVGDLTSQLSGTLTISRLNGTEIRMTFPIDEPG